MVNTIDGTKRRRDLAEAVWRLVEREGLTAASVRSVAAESGLSTGSVRHFFGTQRELITFAMRELTTTVLDRIRTESATGTPQERALAAVSQLLPLTDATRAEALAHTQFVTAARFDPELQELAEESFAGIRGVCVQAVTLLRDAGQLPADTDVEARGAVLAALVDGLTLELLFAPALLTRERAGAMLHAHLTGVS